jgi:hypothetical protein
MANCFEDYTTINGVDVEGYVYGAIRDLPLQSDLEKYNYELLALTKQLILHTYPGVYSHIGLIVPINESDDPDWIIYDTLLEYDLLEGLTSVDPLSLEDQIELERILVGRSPVEGCNPFIQILCETSEITPEFLKLEETIRRMTQIAFLNSMRHLEGSAIAYDELLLHLSRVNNYARFIPKTEQVFLDQNSIAHRIGDQELKQDFIRARTLNATINELKRMMMSPYVLVNLGRALAIQDLDSDWSTVILDEAINAYTVLRSSIDKPKEIQFLGRHLVEGALLSHSEEPYLDVKQVIDTLIENTSADLRGAILGQVLQLVRDNEISNVILSDYDELNVYKKYFIKDDMEQEVERLLQENSLEGISEFVGSLVQVTGEEYADIMFSLYVSNRVIQSNEIFDQIYNVISTPSLRNKYSILFRLIFNNEDQKRLLIKKLGDKVSFQDRNKQQARKIRAFLVQYSLESDWDRLPIELR